ncbi:chymotrypsin-like elastase family member 2A [Bicyclus anynana]|uniref:Chymotrypsin-like elastase family member 2A n=1 Tax=Bicyclus anynana TaxID=110368 RepID=A0ABM3LZG5_BICAN|nr:chymotrypsin-like elastase family member 2A [Bicyclus anynana]
MKGELLILKTLLILIQCNDYVPFVSPILTMYPCLNTRDIVVWYDTTLPPKDRNQYYLYINRMFPARVAIETKFNAHVSITMNIRTGNNTFTPEVLREGVASTHTYRTTNPGLISYGYKVKGTVPGKVPYLTSLTSNKVELCTQPNVGFLDAYTANTVDSETRLDCGRRKVAHTELIFNGEQTKPGDWPWHAALYKFDYPNNKYVCGGTLLSSHFVLTAAHCASVRGVPVVAEVMSVILGKYRLYGGDLGTQEKEVHRIIIHEDFQYRYLHNDIALLKLSTEVSFNDYIQPACLWYSKASAKLLSEEIVGMIVGWGFDSSYTLSRTIRQTQMPMVPDSVCMSSNPNFFTSILNDKKFCAGYRNHSSPCNGDSGSAFQVFIPDSAQQTVNTHSSGAWLVRGIVSLAVSRDDAAVCDPDEYVVFTDVAEYLTWIQNNVDYDL